MQRTLYPPKVLLKHQNDGTEGSAQDSNYYGQCDDGNTYRIKDSIETNNFQPINEWYGYNLCRIFEIPTPNPGVIDLDGKLVFGSQFELRKPPVILKDLFEGKLPTMQSIPNFISSSMVIDCFCKNFDRHLNNILCVENSNNFQLKLFDFGRSFLFESYPPNKNYELPPECNTSRFYSAFKKNDIFDIRGGELTIQKLREVNASEVLALFSSAPSEWLPKNLIYDIKDWWGSKEFHDLLNKITTWVRSK